MGNAKIAFGFGSLNCIAKAPVKHGQLLWTSTIELFRNNSGGAGYSQPLDAVAGNAAYQRDAVLWLTGKSSGANLLIVGTVGGGVIDSQFVAGLLALGHSYVYTGAGSSFNGQNPLTYDAVICEGLSESTATMDAYLAAKGSIWLSSAGANFSRYGADKTGVAQTYTGGGVDHQYCATHTIPVLGGPYTMTTVFALKLQSTTNTIGGTTTIYQNNYGENSMATWVQ